MKADFINKENFVQCMMSPFMESMKEDIHNANSKNSKQFLADIALKCWEIAKTEGCLSESYIRAMEEYDIPYIRMFADGVTVHEIL